MSSIRTSSGSAPAAPRAGCLPAWIGHVCFEHNSPATLRPPLYRLRGDLEVLGEVLTARMRW